MQEGFIISRICLDVAADFVTLLYENIDELECQHGADLFLGEASLDELGLRDPSVVIFVHLLERYLGNRRLTLVLRVVFFTEQMKQSFHNSVHLFPETTRNYTYRSLAQL